MPTAVSWLAFLVASLLFIQVPGPSLLFTIGRALTVGRRDALLSVVGNGLGLLAQVACVALGLGAVVESSATAYLLVKVLGGAYVVWLGVQAVRHRSDARLAMVATGHGAPAPRPGRALRIGFTVGVTNPKTLVFFTAFLPQFIDAADGHAWFQLLVLGLAFAALAVASDSVWALVAGRARAWFGAEPRRLDRISAAGGAMMVALGVTMVARD